MGCLITIVLLLLRVHESSMKNLQLLHYCPIVTHCVKSVRIWSYTGPYSVRMRENTDRITTNTDTFHAVIFAKCFSVKCLQDNRTLKVYAIVM